MKVWQVIQEKYIHNVDFDMATFAKNMAALRTNPSQKDNFPDSIMFLGALGDPSSKLSWLRKPARIGNYDRAGEYDAGLNVGPWANTNRSPRDNAPGGRSVPSGQYTDDTRIDPRLAANPNEIVFDIFINLNDGDGTNPRQVATGQVQNLAHEFRHRGFAVIDAIPELINNMPEVYQSVTKMGYETREKNGIYIMRSLLNNPKYRNQQGQPNHNWYLTHAMMYSLEGDFRPPYDSPEQFQAFKKLYFDCASIVDRYLNSKKVPPQGWELLRQEVDRRTPKSVDISIKPSPQGPVVVGTKHQPNTGASAPRIIVDPWGKNSKPAPKVNQPTQTPTPTNTSKSMPNQQTVSEPIPKINPPWVPQGSDIVHIAKNNGRYDVTVQGSDGKQSLFNKTYNDIWQLDKTMSVPTDFNPNRPQDWNRIKPTT